MDSLTPVLGIVVPCYNEQEIIAYSAGKLLETIQRLIGEKLIHENSFLGIVDDRSRDDSWSIIKGLTSKHPQVRAIRLASNRGHQFALLAGLSEFRGGADCLISMDADLQDDVGVIGLMVEKFKQGNDIVFGVRNKRNSDTFFKRVSAYAFYRLLRSFGVNVMHNHADFRLTSRRVNEELDNFKEVNLFLRGIFPLMGFNTAIVHYERAERLAGTSKYPLKRMISLALDGITSFSTIPLRIITLLGFLVFIICMLLMVYAMRAYFTNGAIAGWFSTVLPYYFLGGVQILCIGIIGEYLGKIYKEVKGRPRYIIEEKINKE
jgi:glycosyltransferase involved in cell wall biosynthesis